MHLVEKHKIKVTNKHYKTFEKLSKYSNNLYNQALYMVKQSLEQYQANGDTEDKTKGWLFYNELDRLCKSLPDNYNNYRLLPSACSQQLLRMLDKNLKSYRQAIKAYSKTPDKFKGKPDFPHYRKRGDRNILLFTNQQCKNKGGKLSFPRIFKGFTIKLRNPEACIKQVRVIPKFAHFVVEVVHEVPDVPLVEDKGLIASIDLGLDNLATVVFSDFSQPLIINGKPLKSLNVSFNHNLRAYKSVLDKTQKGQYHSKRLAKMYQKREYQINDYLHKVCSKLVSQLVEKGTTEVIIGHNIHQKQGAKLTNFVQVPVFKMIDHLRYKLALNGVRLTEVEESYTSGTSFLDGEATIQADYLKSRRLHRGLFKSNQGKLINADVNGAYQIMRKIHRWVVYQGQTAIFNPVKL